MADDVQPVACDCECHRTGSPASHDCCEGMCLNCGKYLKAGLAGHTAKCGEFLRRVPAPVTRQVSGGAEGVR